MRHFHFTQSRSSWSKVWEALQSPTIMLLNSYQIPYSRSCLAGPPGFSSDDRSLYATNAANDLHGTWGEHSCGAAYPAIRSTSLYRLHQLKSAMPVVSSPLRKTYTPSVASLHLRDTPWNRRKYMLVRERASTFPLNLPLAGPPSKTPHIMPIFQGCTATSCLGSTRLPSHCDNSKTKFTASLETLVESPFAEGVRCNGSLPTLRQRHTLYASKHSPTCSIRLISLSLVFAPHNNHSNLSIYAKEKK